MQRVENSQTTQASRRASRLCPHMSHWGKCLCWRNPSDLEGQRPHLPGDGKLREERVLFGVRALAKTNTLLWRCIKPSEDHLQTRVASGGCLVVRFVIWYSSYLCLSVQSLCPGAETDFRRWRSPTRHMCELNATAEQLPSCVSHYEPQRHDSCKKIAIP